MKAIAPYKNNLYTSLLRYKSLETNFYLKQLLFLFLIFTLLFSPVCLLSLEAPAHAKAKTPFPKPQGYVNDLAGLLTPQSAQHLERLITSIKQKTSAEVAIVTLNSIEPYSIEDYAVRLYENWGIGQKGKDNGVLLLVAVQAKPCDQVSVLVCVLQHI